ncbi:MAG: ABC transporter permease [Xanthobacteraceae bacterium]|nr:ABC transporter permease [Hyphomicrobiales bacterium]MBN8984918.1 ABC transporter permease [Hyphomicrobiales bacterium]
MTRSSTDLGQLARIVLLLPATIIVVVGYVLPSLVLAALSFGIVPGVWVFSEATTSHYMRLLGDIYYLRVVGYTLFLGIVVSVLTAVLAFPVGYYLARSRSRLTSLYAVLTFTPLAVGMNMVTLGWMIILGKTGFINALLLQTGAINDPLQLLYGWGAVIVAMVHVVFTFMVLPIEAVVRQIDPSLEKAARILGAGPIRTFIEVVLPLSLPGIAAGFLIVFLQVCGAFVLPLLLGGQGFTLMPIAIWEQITVSFDRSFAATLSVALILISIVVMLLQMRIMREKSLV